MFGPSGRVADACSCKQLARPSQSTTGWPEEAARGAISFSFGDPQVSAHTAVVALMRFNCGMLFREGQGRFLWP